jgi:asparagine synthase (glutamine-hydrolysing)
MCGIAGFTGRRPPEALGRAMATIAYRGPDAQGRYEDPFVSIGHCRLSIIDAALGHQPMHSADGRYVLAFNGEIYNFRDLRQTLERQGHTFRTSSDTEVLLRWLTCRGRDGLPDLNGMFALALWDRREKRLLLARDRLGIKPLYLYEKGNAFAFASEIKAIHALVGHIEPNLQTVFQFLTFQNVLTDQTFFTDVAKLPPGGWIEWSPAGITRGRFWSLSFPSASDLSFDEIVEQYRHALDRAVDRHMIADVPVGSYLSGGIDSASVTVLAARRAQAPMHTFTGAFVDAPYYDERPGSRAVAARAGATLHEVEITSDDFCADFGRVVYHLDEPTLGMGALPQFVVARLAARHVKVVLTGHGGDEAFAGYQVSKAVLLRDLITTRPLAAIRHLARVSLDEMSRVAYFSVFPFIQPEVGYGLFIMTPRNRRRRRLTGSFLGAMEGYEPLDEVRQFIGPGMTSGEVLQSLYLKTYLPTLFIQEDKVGMAHSLESRMPLCDNEIIDLALSVDFAQKMHGGVLKAIPRAAMRRDLPDLLYTLPKRGFPTPFARWFRQGRVREMVEDLLLSRRAIERGIFEPEGAARLFTTHLKSRGDNLLDYARASELYSMAAVELWFRTYIDGATSEPVQ